MIVSASRRTDIPALYADWLMNRLVESFALVSNPYRPGQLSRVALTPETVDCLVLWSKDPAPMLPKLDRLEEMGYPYYFQFTLTPYGPEVEPGLPEKAVLLETFRKLARRCGPERVVWRYDPVLLDEDHTIPWHIEAFAQMCRALEGSTRRCVFSFVDRYRGSRFRTLTAEEMEEIGGAFARIAEGHSLPLYTCAETIDLSAYGVGHSACIDGQLIGSLLGCPIGGKKDKNQRAACGCLESVDLGAYDTCIHGCAYCYGTSGQRRAQTRHQAHDPRSPLLTGWPSGDERIVERAMPSLKQSQTSLF